jgi:hypothetical protein
MAGEGGSEWARQVGGFEGQAIWGRGTVLMPFVQAGETGHRTAVTNWGLRRQQWQAGLAWERGAQPQKACEDRAIGTTNRQAWGSAVESGVARNSGR